MWDAIGRTLGAFGVTFGIPILRCVFDAKIVHFGGSLQERETAAVTPGGLARGRFNTILATLATYLVTW